MIYEKMMTSADFSALRNRVVDKLTSASASVMYCAPLAISGDATTGRCVWYSQGPHHEERVAFEPRVTTPYVTTVNSTTYIKCDYLSGDFFEYSADVTGKALIEVPNMSISGCKGRSVLLKVTLGNATSTYFANVTTPIFTINSGTDYPSGTYYFVFANMTGDKVELINFFKGYPALSSTTGLRP